MATLAPPPVNDPVGSFIWLEWYRQLRDYLVTASSVPWNVIDFTGSNITSIALRAHNDLQSISGGSPNNFWHLTQTQHTDLTDGGETTLHNHRTDSESWEDLRFPAQGINPPGAAADPTVSSTSGTLLFSGITDNVIVGVAQMPHAWKEGSTVRPHIHLRFPTATTNNTRWRFEYDIANITGDFTNALGTYTTLSTITVTNPNNVNRHVAASFGDLTMTGFTRSAIILWKITRLANSDAADNETNDVALLEFDIHYVTNRNGTETET